MIAGHISSILPDLGRIATLLAVALCAGPGHAQAPCRQPGPASPPCKQVARLQIRAVLAYSGVAEVRLHVREPSGTRTIALSAAALQQFAARYGACAPLALRRVESALRGSYVGKEPPQPFAPLLKWLSAQVPYQFWPHVSMTLTVEQALAELAARFHQKTGQRLTVTSGTRGPERQAKAMLTKIRLGSRLRRVYRRWDLAEEIVKAYREQRGVGPAAVAAMTQVIDRQVCAGLFVSEHLKRGAVDLRTRVLSRRHRRVLKRLLIQTPNVRFKEERRPPHLHVEFSALGREQVPESCRPPWISAAARAAPISWSPGQL